MKMERTYDIPSGIRREKPEESSHKNISCADTQRNTLKNMLHRQCSVPKRQEVEESAGLSSVEGGILKLENFSKVEDATEFDLWARSVAVQLNKMDVRRALQLQLKLQAIITEERLKYETQRHHDDINQQYPSSWLNVVSASGLNMATNQSVVALRTTTAETQLSAVSSPTNDSVIVDRKDF
jgi:hypothetical protein